MPTFNTDAEIDISPKEFLEECSGREKDYLIHLLGKEGTIIKMFPVLKTIEDELKLDILVKMYKNLSLIQLTELETS